MKRMCAYETVHTLVVDKVCCNTQFGMTTTSLLLSELSRLFDVYDVPHPNLMHSLSNVALANLLFANSLLYKIVINLLDINSLQCIGPEFQCKNC